MIFIVSCKAGKIINKVQGSGLPLNDSIVQKFQTGSNLLIGFKTFFNDRSYIPSKYYFVSEKAGKTFGYSYGIKAHAKKGETSTAKIDTTIIPSDKYKKLLQLIKSQNAWNLKSPDATNHGEPCPHQPNSGCKIEDAGSEIFFIVAKSKMTSTTFYAVDFFEKDCCPGNPERSSYLAIRNFIKDLIR